MIPIPVNTNLFKHQVLPANINSSPYFFTYKSQIILYWPQVKIVGVMKYIIGSYFCVIKTNGQICSYVTQNWDKTIGTVSNISVAFINGQFKISTLGSYCRLFVPDYFLNNSLINVQYDNASIYSPYFDCITTGNRNGLVYGPINIATKTDNDIAYIFNGNEYQYNGVIFSYPKSKISEQSINIFSSDGSNPQNITYGVGGSNISQQSGREIFLQNPGSGFLNAISISEIIASYNSTTYCGVGLLHPGVYDLSWKKTLIHIIPDTHNYVIGASNNPYFFIGSCGLAGGGYFYLWSNILGYEGLFSNFTAIGGYIGSLFIDGTVYLLYFDGTGIYVYVVTNLSTFFIYSKYPNNNNDTAISSFDSPLLITNSETVSSKYLINFNRPISAIGAYKT